MGGGKVLYEKRGTMDRNLGAVGARVNTPTRKGGTVE